MYSVDSCATKIMFIIPDEILDTISCDFCHKILSVGPVRVYPNRKTKCGRCSEVGDSGIISQYELLAQHSLYKCVNRFDGCKKLLSYDQVAEHEATCHSKTYYCPVCPETTEIPTFLLVKHFTQEHAENFLKIPLFDIDTTTTSKRTYLYRVRNNLFFIESGCNSVYEITLNTFFLGDSKDAFRIKQKFTLMYGAGSKKIETNSKRCDYLGTPNPGGYKLDKPGVDVISAVFELSLPEDEDLFILSRPDFNNKCSSTRSDNADNNSGSLARKLKAALSRKITLGSGFQQDFPAHSVNSNSTALLITHNTTILTVAPYCCNCSVPLPASSNYLETKLRKYQPICETCEVCFQQISPEIRFINWSKLYTHSPYNHVTYSCIWNCKAEYHAKEILQHEIICQNQQPQACPVQSCTYYSKLYDLEEHFKAIHPQDLISLTPIFHTKHKSIPEKWYVWVQFGFLSIKVSSEDGGRDYYNGQKTRWKIAVESILKGDVHVEPKCLAYHESTCVLITSSSDFESPDTEIKFLSYFEMS